MKSISRAALHLGGRREKAANYRYSDSLVHRDTAR
jgi:hypothetical protein